MSRLLVALAVSLVVSSCRPNADAVCVPGKAEACACPGGAAGSQEGNADGSGATSCGGHGTCSDATGQVRCTCAAGYAGADCTTCDTGTQDHDGDGTCAATCATASLSCGTRARCDDASGVARCQCVGGFAEDAGLADGGINCLFVGGPLDPGFQNTPAKAWTRDAGGWTMNPAGPEPRPPGAAVPGSESPGVARHRQARRQVGEQHQPLADARDLRRLRA